MSTARHLPRGRAWLRTLVLLLALLVPGAHAEVHATPVAAAETVGYDALDAALRPPAEAVRRTVAVLRPAPRPIPAQAPATPAGRPRQAPPRPPHALPALRTVVLRC